MEQVFFQEIARETGKALKDVSRCIALLEDGATVPFISRYRKEHTGNMDEVMITRVLEMKEKYEELEKRREHVLKVIDQQGQLNESLKKDIMQCRDLQELEDIYLPYRPKRRTRATIAREKGLEPLAKIIMAQQENNIERRATQYINEDVPDISTATEGAQDIIAEWINEHAGVRRVLRKTFQQKGMLKTRKRKSNIEKNPEQAEKYADYYGIEEGIHKMAAHRFLAVLRAENEGFLSVSVNVDKEDCEEQISRLILKKNRATKEYVMPAVEDAYKRLLQPALENEIKTEYKKRADEASVKIFSENLRQLLMAAPLGRKRVLAIDPGFRSGCKVVCMGENGDLKHNETIYPHPPQKERRQAKKKMESLADACRAEAIAIGNGTASRETERFVKSLKFKRDITVFVVSENGASVYSASKIAREEFPQYDVTVRGAVSIGRRLRDPLAELVKIDPASIGVGQYQHDVDQKMLRDSLDRVVESCVNAVGVDVNTASKHLLKYVSGLGPVLAENIAKYRSANGAFDTRQDLLNVPRMGDKAFRLAAGFLRIPQGSRPLDNSAVHPEAYGIVNRMADDLGVLVDDMIGRDDLEKTLHLEDYVTETIGIPSLEDIVNELAKPGRDPREEIEVFTFNQNVHSMDDLEPGMRLPGIVTNVTAFGAFVDIGIKENGLVHISNMADRFIKDPAEVVHLHQHVIVRVLEVNKERKRIQLSMK